MYNNLQFYFSLSDVGCDILNYVDTCQQSPCNQYEKKNPTQKMILKVKFVGLNGE